VQLPLSQYAPGSESAQLVTNGGFESGALNWTPTGNIITAAPIFSNTSNNGLLSAQMNDTASPASYSQAAPALAPNANYVLSAYIWNGGRYDTSGGGFGDLATVKLIDPPNGTTNNISLTLEAQASDGGAGSNGYFMYVMANQAQMAAWSTIEIQAIGEEGLVSGGLPANWAQFDNIALTPLAQFAGQKWSVNSGGNYSDTTKWVGGKVPNAKGAVASFDTGGAGVRNVNIDAPITVGAIRFNDAGNFTLSSATNAITLDVGLDGFMQQQGVPEIATNAGGHFINAPVNMPRSTILSGGGVLTFQSTVSYGTGITLTKNDSGTVIIPNVRTDTLAINGGVLHIRPDGTDAGTSNVQTLTIAGSNDNWSAKLDLDNNSAVVDYTTNTPFATIQNQLKNGYASGNWTGSGINSSAAAATASSAHKTAIGYAEASEVFSSFPANFKGQSVDATSVLMRHVYYGDANLDGAVDTVDFNLLAGNFSAASGNDWAHGDFNYDSTVDTTDFNLLASNFGLVISPAAPAGAMVPEPSMLGLLVVVPMMLRRSRRQLV
jgi:hypothetical protein